MKISLKILVIISLAMIIWGAQNRKSPHVLPDLCVGCEDCVRICPRAKQGAIKIIEGKAIVDDNTCISCNMCVNICSFGALKRGW